MTHRVPTHHPTLDEVLAGVPLTPAEEELLARAGAGEMAEFGKIRPETSTDANRLRAGLIRFLLLGGDGAHPVDPKGVQVQGAFIAGVLDFEKCETQLDLRLSVCRLDSPPNLQDAHLGALFLPGCFVPGINLHRLRTKGSVHLRDGFLSCGTVDLGSARIGGRLDCAGADLSGTEETEAGATKIGPALNGHAMTVGASVQLGEGFTARGQVNLVLAIVAGSLSCRGGRFDGVMLRDADGRAVARGIALRGQEMRVGSSFLWSGVQGADLQVDLREAEIGPLVDDADSWRKVTLLGLGGFRYRSLASDMTIGDRLEWLGRAAQRTVVSGDWGRHLLPKSAPDFDPQPYTHLAQLLRARGERRGAARVLFERERRLARAEFDRAIAGQRVGDLTEISTLKAWFFRVVTYCFRILFGYGHFPALALLWAIGIWGVTALFVQRVYDAGQMAPAPAIILTSGEWLDAVGRGCPLPSAPDHAARVADGCEEPLFLWAGRAETAPGKGDALPAMDSAKDYETFSAGLYALDLFLPLDALGQEAAWAPSKDRGSWGWWGFHLRWVVKALGWILAVVGAAVLTGLIGKRDE